MPHTPTIACDFDGCLCEHRFPECGAPITDVVALLRQLEEEGWLIVIHSCRANSDWVGKGASEQEARKKVDDMVEFLLENDVPFHSIWGITMTSHADPFAWEYSGVSGKPVADVYLDDRALHPGHLKAEGMRQRCQWIVQGGGDPLAFHRSLGRMVD